jgi:wyosine [tRNA(Phe)-imidazoG37] synthetase (radical SAM superfamily)
MSDYQKQLKEINIPEPGTSEWERMIDGMRKMERYSGVIIAARESIEARGLNFDEEFAKWKENKS